MESAIRNRRVRERNGLSELHHAFLGTGFLHSVWGQEFEAFKGGQTEAELIQRLERWRDRTVLTETSAEQTFVDVFFREIWNYWGTGEREAAKGYTLYPKFSVEGAGQTGKTGEADLALGWFNRDGIAATPQVLCEFKDIRSDLDAPQKRKGNTRSPVQQCKDYLWGARRGLFGNEAIIPTWGIVTDMNEFRLYWWDRMPQQYLRFVIEPRDLLGGRSLLAQGEDARFERFLFWKLFHSETLLTLAGKSPLERLLARQWVREREIENDFYQEYREIRERLYNNLVVSNPDYEGTRGHLVHLAQKILDRCIFLFYCEDMGYELAFPPQLLRDFLISRSNDEYFDPNGTEIWERIKALFHIMNEGGVFPPDKRIGRFNGGLFADDPELESLRLPNNVFCEQGQGQNEASLYSHPKTLLYLSASYNYADKGDATKTLGLYTLGRIFEQSITELEMLEALAEGRESLNKLSKRKTNGVYYTPEHIVEKIVEETLGPRLLDLRSESGWKEGRNPSNDALNHYWNGLRKIKIVDPACGSGAFLITALRVLRDEYRAVQDLRKKRKIARRTREEGELIEDILSNNLYGVDINPASVEITKLALWLHTARRDQPLSALDTHIRDGNSLIDNSFYLKSDLIEYAEDQRERVNAFDWWKAFPEVAEQGGFDVVVGNPPYVKLQNFRRVHPDMAQFLREGRQGKSFYASTQTGNFDLYLPFIEKGLELLSEKGRMGYIAPSLWLVNDYGEGLRELVHRTRALDRWIDFKSYQVFAEATTYTALQFFSKSENKSIALYQAHQGQIAAIDWNNEENRLPYLDICPARPWHILPRRERSLLDKLSETCRRLDDGDISTAIFQGLVTSADRIYHLRRLDTNKYLCIPKKDDGAPYEVTIEDDLMRPLVSGYQAGRYTSPETDIYILFPYDIAGQTPRLIPAKTFEQSYPNAWNYLRSYEKELRGRENGKMDLDDKWWGYVYPKNLNKHKCSKFIVPRIVERLRFYFDRDGEFYLDNVDVGGLIAAQGINPLYLLGVLNSPVTNFVFRRISKPFRGDYRSANKQFIAPLPIPVANPTLTNKIASQAGDMQAMTVRRLELVSRLERRLSGMKPVIQPVEWIFPDIGPLDQWIDDAPRELSASERLVWAKSEREITILARYEEIERLLWPGAILSSEQQDGELRFLVDGTSVIQNVFVDAAAAPFMNAQWDYIARTFSITDKTKAKKLIDALRKFAPSSNAALVAQVMDLHARLVALDAELATTEGELNGLIYKAYNLTDSEIRLIENG